MNFTEIAYARQSCRNYDTTRLVEPEKINAILESARLAPSASNSQAYHFTVCTGQTAKAIADACDYKGLNKFTHEAPVHIVISEKPYNKSAALGVKLMNTDYRSIDMGIVAAFMCSEATAQGLGNCIIGWFNQDKVMQACNLDVPARLIITLGYPGEKEKLRVKKRKDMEELVTNLD